MPKDKAKAKLPARVRRLPPARAAALPAILDRYLEGESIQTIAADHGVSRRALYQWLLGGMGDADYSDAVTHALVYRVADADQALEAADDPVHIARARETARFARMDLERRRPALYGQKQAIDVTVKTDMAERLADARQRLRERVIEAEPAEASQIPNGSHVAGGTV